MIVRESNGQPYKTFNEKSSYFKRIICVLIKNNDLALLNHQFLEKNRRQQFDSISYSDQAETTIRMNRHSRRAQIRLLMS